MSEINLHEFQDALSDSFRRYLFSQNALPDREQSLREAFWGALQELGVFSREPLLSVIPAYKPDRPAAALLGKGRPPVLHHSLAGLPPSAFDVNRPLYTHQVRSIEKIQSGRNVIVATGTGSGKTECFLLPVLDDALRNPGDGVRAIVVYPLNALANDQLGRLRSLLRTVPSITFGRYTGDTPWDRAQLTEREAREILEPNERYTREEIRSAPPHILLTNFAMLEYLLLRPRDTDIFRQQRLQYVILDEAHCYAGAQGIEVGLLMRRLQQAFPDCNLRFILTSATLGDNLAAIADFGRKLTGGAFTPEDVIFGETREPFQQPLVAGGTREQFLAAVPDEAALNRWLAALEDSGALAQLIGESGLFAGRLPARPNSVGQLLGGCLASCLELSRLHEAAAARPVTFSEASRAVWGDDSEESLRLTRWLTILGARAAPDSSAPPLLPARYHLFFRGLRGGSVCVSPACPGRAAHPGTAWSHFMLEDRLTCPLCEAHVLPLFTCVHCGAPALKVYENRQGMWQSVAPPVPERVHLLRWGAERVEGEDEEELPLERPAELCVACGSFRLGGDLPAACCEAPAVVRLTVLPSQGDGNLKECPTCGGGKGGFQSVLRPFATGEDAATTVLAESIIRAMPEEDPTRPAHGRRLLAFSDSRQRAAFFAPYLARTTAESQYLKPLLDAIVAADRLAEGQGASLDEIAATFVKSTRNQPFVVVRRTNEEDGECTTEIKRPGQLFQEDNRHLKRECLISLLSHFTSPARDRTTIPGLGLAAAAVDLNGEQREGLVALAPRLFSQGEDAAWALVQCLLQVVLRKKALILPEGIVLGHIQSLGPKQYSMHNNLADRLDGRQRCRWNPYLAAQPGRVVPASIQAEIVAQHLGVDKVAGGEAVSALLDEVWGAFRDLEIFVSPTGWPSEYVLHTDRLLVRADVPWWICRNCGVLTPYPVRGACVQPGCGGKLRALPAEERERRWENNHRFKRLTRTPALPLEVREHTAQLTNDVGREYQQRFNDRMINVLSSSTTFEMGVDVGQLKTVFLRNVPPTPANYIQRAGRAGRRCEGASFAVTYARTLPHDQVHFHEPQRIVSGTVPVPRINIANPRLTQRHVNSFLLGHYLRSLPQEGAREQLRVVDFFVMPTNADSPAAAYAAWLAGNAAGLAGATRRVIDEACELTVNEAFDQSSGQLQTVRAGIVDQLTAYDRQREELEGVLRQSTDTRERRSALQSIESVTRLRGQLLETRLIDYLASAHWLPSYAFPQDVVKLLVRQPLFTGRMRLERDAEYGIAEYAPGAEVVADGLLFKSRGIDLQNKVLEESAYRACSRCNRVQFASRRSELRPACEFCGERATGPRSTPREFVEPKGFTTAIDEAVGEVRLNRLKAPPNSIVFLIKGADEDDFRGHPDLPGITLGYQRDGELFRANSGRQLAQFRICLVCGRGLDEGRVVQHLKPWGVRCPNTTITKLDLACKLQTDTLQVRFDGVTPAPPTVDDEAFWISFQTAFTAAAADVLSIPPGDIDGTYRSQASGGMRGELVIYDRVPGGAGYVSRIREELPAILRASLRRVRECPNPECDPEGSCYACLRTYGNQFKWESLRRAVVSEWLERIVGT